MLYMYQLLESNNQLCSINCSLEILENIFGFDLILVYLVLSFIIYVTGDCRFQMHEVGYGITDLTACQNVLTIGRSYSPHCSICCCAITMLYNSQDMQPMFYLYEVVQQIILYSIIEIHVVWYMFQYGRRFPKSCGPLLLDS